MKKIIYISGLITSCLILNGDKLNAQINNGTNTLSNNSSSTGNSNTGSGSYSFSTGVSNSVTGTYGFATGASNTASGSHSFASGYNSSVTNVYGFTHGFGNQTYGQYSASLGMFAYANGNRSYAIGESAKATGTSSYSFGKSTQATGTNSLSLGYYSIASGANGVAVGTQSRANGNNSFGIGRYSEANGNNSYSIGEYVSTSNTNAFSIGRGLITGPIFNQTIHYLDNNTSNSLVVGFNSDTATLFVGPSTGVGTFGKVGIATSSPIRTFDVNGMSHFADTMSIGTTKTNGSMLAVAGKISAEEIELSLTTTWPDFVFSSSYQLNTLAQVEEHINKYSHLPNVPSAEEVAKKGINIAEMDAILLQKIEELTLYTIAQQKQLDEQYEAAENQQKQLDKQNKVSENQQKLIEEQQKLIEQLIELNQSKK